MLNNSITKSSLRVSSAVWFFIIVFIFLRDFLTNDLPQEAYTRIFSIWLSGEIIMILILIFISYLKESKRKWLYTATVTIILNLLFSLILLKTQSDTIEISSTKKNVPEEKADIIIEEGNSIKKINTKIGAEKIINYNLFWLLSIASLSAIFSNIGIESNSEKIAKIRLQEKLLKAQLDILTAQLNPHFMFNALNNVSALIDHNPSEAQEVLEDFSFLLRDVINRSKNQFNTLEQEIDFIKKYIKVEKKRFHSKLNVEYNISESVSDSKIPTLLLQPIVENAIKHGIINRYHENESDYQGQIVIKSFKEGNRLIVKVIDNGSGIKNNSMIKGTGLNNTTERLKNLYSNNYSLSFDSKGTGLSVTINIPFKNSF